MVHLAVNGKRFPGIKGIAWDKDGVIDNSQRNHATVEAALCKELGVMINPTEISRRFSGMNTKEVFRIILAEGEVHLTSSELDDLLERKWAQILTSSEPIVQIPGSVELIQLFYSNGILQTVASSSRRAFIEKCLKALEVERYFVATVAGEEVSKGKPAPDIFLKASKLMNVHPENCLVIEDGVSGVIAAQAAGMRVIFLGTPRDDIRPDAFISSLDQITIEEIE